MRLKVWRGCRSHIPELWHTIPYVVGWGKPSNLCSSHSNIRAQQLQVLVHKKETRGQLTPAWMLPMQGQMQKGRLRRFLAWYQQAKFAGNRAAHRQPLHATLNALIPLSPSFDLCYLMQHMLSFKWLSSWQLSELNLGEFSNPFAIILSSADP